MLFPKFRWSLLIWGYAKKDCYEQPNAGKRLLDILCFPKTIPNLSEKVSKVSRNISQRVPKFMNKLPRHDQK